MLTPISTEAFEPDLEIRIRTIISEILTPLVQKTSENEQLVKESLQRNRETKKSLEELSNDYRKTIPHLVKFDDFNKSIHLILSETKSSVQFLNFSIEEINAKVSEAIHKHSDQDSQIKSLQNMHATYTKNIDDNYRYIREFQDIINREINLMNRIIRNFVTDQSPINESTTERINAINIKLNEINSKAFPELTCLIEKKNVQIEDLSQKLEESLKNRVTLNDFKSFTTKINNDMLKINIEVTSEMKNITKFLDNMLRVEISCGIADALVQVLDSRYLKKIVPLFETQISENLGENKKKLPMPKLNSEKLTEKTMAHLKVLESNISNMKEKISKENEKKNQDTLRKTNESLNSLQELDSIEKRFSIPKKNQEEITKTFEKISALKLSDIKNIEVPKVFNGQNSRGTQIDDNELDPNLKITARSIGSDDLNEEFSKISTNFKEINEKIAKFAELYDAKLSKMSQQVEITASMLTEELKYSIKSKATEISAILLKIDNLQKESNDLFTISQDNNNKSEALWENFKKIMENLKIIQILLVQDEEDRQSLQLSVYTEGKAKSKSPTKQRQVVALKPECLSCSGQNSIIYSAFKMACLNYAPSDVLYGGKIYSRKDMIEKISDNLNGLTENKSIGITEENFKLSPVNTEEISRTKSASRVKRSSRFLFDTSVSKISFTAENTIKNRKKIKAT